MRDRSKATRWDAWDIWIFCSVIVGAFYKLLEHFGLPIYSRIISIVLVVFLAEYLWERGFFDWAKYHSKHDVEVAKKIEASQRRLKEEEERQLKGLPDPPPDHQQHTFIEVDWTCPSCDSSIHLGTGDRYCTNCRYKIR